LYFGAGWLIEYRFIRDPRAYYSLLALAPAVFFVTILSSYRGYLQGCQIMTPTAVSQIAEQLVRVITMLIFASLLLPKGLEYAAGGASLGAAPGAVAGLLVLIYYYIKLQKKRRKSRQTGQVSQSDARVEYEYY
jgi:stage V sporulation protein B